MNGDTKRLKDANRALWNEWTDIHLNSELYDIEDFKSGSIRLHPLERKELGNVSGKNILHLQCHFGLNTMSLARLGATVTGVDFSEKSIALARSLAKELSIPATFVLSDMDELCDNLTGEFDIVFTSYGVLAWLPDLKRWAETVAHFIKPGGFFYIAEFHPYAYTLDDEPDATEPVLKIPYFNSEPTEWPVIGSYADRNAPMKQEVSYEWTHTMSDIINSLIGAGLRIEFFNEFPYTVYEQLPYVVKCDDGLWRMNKNSDLVPLVFSIKASRD